MPGRCGVILKGFDEEKREEVSRILQSMLELGPGQTDDILDSVPIVLFEKLTKAVSEVVVRKMATLSEAGVEIERVSNIPSHLPRIDWPDPPAIVVEAEEEVEEAKTGEKVSRKEEVAKDKERVTKKERKERKEEKEREVVPKYEFVVDERNIFTCPACGAMFLLKAISKEEAEEAKAQDEIKRLLEMKDEVGAIAETGAGEENEGSTVEGLPLDEDLPIVEEMAVNEVAEPLAAPMPETSGIPPIKVTDEFMGIREFERGFDEGELVEDVEGEETEEKTDTSSRMEDVAEEPFLGAEEKGGEEVEEVVEETPAPLPLEGDDYGEALMEELEKLPEEKPPAVLGGVSEETGGETGVEELSAEEMLKYIERRRREKEVKKQTVVSSEEEGEAEDAVRPVSPTRLIQPKRKEEEVPSDSGGSYGVVISRLTTTEKKRRAAEVMEEELGIPIEEGMRICSGGLIVNVAKGLDEEKARTLYQRFREVGVMARITERRRRRRR